MKKFIAALGSTLVLCAPAHAEHLSFDYSGYIYFIYKYDFVTPSISFPDEITVGDQSISIGKKVTGTFAYDSATPLVASVESRDSAFVGSAASVSGSLKFDGASTWVRSVSSSQTGEIRVYDNDIYLGDYVDLGYTPAPGSYVDRVQFSLKGNDNSALDAHVLPTALEKFSGSVAISLGDPAVPGIRYTALAQMTTLQPSISPVPEPTTYAMILAGLGLLGWRRRALAQPGATR